MSRPLNLRGRVSLCRRAVRSPGRPPAWRSRHLACCPATVSCTAASRSFASASCRPRVSGARSPRSKANTSRTTGDASVSSSGCTMTCTLNFIPGSPQRRPPAHGKATENLIAGLAVETLQAQQRHQGGQFLAVHADVGQVVAFADIHAPGGPAGPSSARSRWRRRGRTPASPEVAAGSWTCRRRRR